MRKHAIISLAAVSCLVGLYLGAYVCARRAHVLVHVLGCGCPISPRHDVQPGSGGGRLAEAAETAFWPLCRAEVAVRDVISGE